MISPLDGHSRDDAARFEVPLMTTARVSGKLTISGKGFAEHL
jgi:hypothetical protein